MGIIIGDKFTKQLSIFPTIINVRLSDQREILISMKVNEIIGGFYSLFLPKVYENMRTHGCRKLRIRIKNYGQGIHIKQINFHE